MNTPLLIDFVNFMPKKFIEPDNLWEKINPNIEYRNSRQFRIAKIQMMQRRA